MPKASDFPKFRVAVKRGKAGQTWTSYSYDRRSTGQPDILLGTDRDLALAAWRAIREGAAPESVLMPKAPSLRTKLKGKRRQLNHPEWAGAPQWAKPLLMAAETRSLAAGRAEFITITDYLAVVARAAGRCEVTGIQFDDSREWTGRRRPFAPSLDRIDSTKGYVAGNVRLVCLIVNCALGDFGDDAFERMARAYVGRVAGAELPHEGVMMRERLSLVR